MTHTILAIDPASCTGWALFDVDDNGCASIRGLGAIEVDKTATSEGHRMLSLRQQLLEVVRTLEAPPAHAHIESFFFNRRTCNGSELNVVLRAAVYQLLAELGVPYSLHGPSHWKKYISGTSVPRKADVTKFGKTKAAKAYIMQALAEKYNIHFATHTLIRGRRLQFKADISDAVGIGIYGMSVSQPGLRVAPYDAREPTLTISTRVESSGASIDVP